MYGQLVGEGAIPALCIPMFISFDDIIKIMAKYFKPSSPLEILKFIFYPNPNPFHLWKYFMYIVLCFFFFNFRRPDRFFVVVLELVAQGVKWQKKSQFEYCL